MGQYENFERARPQPSNDNDANNGALDGGAILFDQSRFAQRISAEPDGVKMAQADGPLFQNGTGSSFRDNLRARLQGRQSDLSGQPLTAGDVANPERTQGQNDVPKQYPSVRDRVPTPVNNLPRLQYYPPTENQPSLLESTNSKKTDLNEPYISKTTDQGNTLVEALARAGASALFISKDYTARSAAIEKQIAETELVSPGTRQSFQMARDRLLGGLQLPIQNAEVTMEGLYKKYPIELFQGSSIPKLSGTGKIMMPHPWDMDQLALADQAHAEKYLKLSSLREQLVAHWPPVASTQLGRLPVNVAGMDIVKAEGLLADAARFDAAGASFTGEVSKTLANNEALKAANTNLVFKNIGALAGAWVTNVVTDGVVNTKHGPSAVVWGADLISPAILFTNRSTLTKYGVVAGSHLLAKLYDKYTEK